MKYLNLLFFLLSSIVLSAQQPVLDACNQPLTTKEKYELNEYYLKLNRARQRPAGTVQFLKTVKELVPYLIGFLIGGLLTVNYYRKRTAKPAQGLLGVFILVASVTALVANSLHPPEAPGFLVACDEVPDRVPCTYVADGCTRVDKQMVVNTRKTGLNIRKTPSTRAELVVKLHKGDSTYCHFCSKKGQPEGLRAGRWCYVTGTFDGKPYAGWAFGWFLK